MPVEIVIDTKKLDALIKRVGGKPLVIALSAGMTEMGGRFQADVVQNRMSGRRGNVGLNAITAGMRRGLLSRTDGDTIADLKTQVGWYSAKQTMIANVQEKGATIVPKRAKVLAWPIRGSAKATRSQSVQGWGHAKKVVIPPRLEFRKRWDLIKGKTGAVISKHIAKMLGGSP